MVISGRRIAYVCCGICRVGGTDRGYFQVKRLPGASAEVQSIKSLKNKSGDYRRRFVFIIIVVQTLIVMQSTLSIIFCLPHSGAVFLFLTLAEKGKILKYRSGGWNQRKATGRIFRIRLFHCLFLLWTVRPWEKRAFFSISSHEPLLYCWLFCAYVTGDGSAEVIVVGEESFWWRADIKLWQR